MSFQSADRNIKEEHSEDPIDPLNNKMSPGSIEDSGSSIQSKNEETKNTKVEDGKKFFIGIGSPKDQIDFKAHQGSYSDRPSYHSGEYGIDRFRNTSNNSLMSIALDFTNKNFLKSGENKQYYLVDWDSRCLQISEKEIIITGGCNKNASYLLNIEKNSLDTLADMGYGRKLHAMAWIDTFPAVIGGFVENAGAVQSVEVFKNSQWVQISPLQYKRYGHAATFHDNKTWVVGGAKSTSEGEETIEVFEKTTWKTLNIQLHLCRVGVGLFASGSNLYILGGFSLNKQTSNEVQILSLSTNTLQPGRNLSEPACFSQNMWKLSNRVIQTYALGGKEVTYQLTP